MSGTFEVWQIVLLVLLFLIVQFFHKSNYSLSAILASRLFTDTTN